jgi:hypothetical protein
MRASPLAVERIEFHNVRVRANSEWNQPNASALPQLAVNLEHAAIEWQSSLSFPEAEVSDPRHFVFRFAFRMIQNKQTESVKLPYDIELDALVFLKIEFEESDIKARFRVVRESGYPILYGAIREAVCNLTARGPHGLWQIPSMNFRDQLDADVADDEQSRLKLLQAKKVTSTKRRAASFKKTTASPRRSERSRFRLVHPPKALFLSPQ